MQTQLQFKMGSSIKDLDSIEKVPGTIYLVIQSDKFGELYYDIDENTRCKLVNRKCLRMDKTGVYPENNVIKLDFGVLDRDYLG